MKKKLLFLTALILSLASFSQNSNEEFKPNGEPILRIFWNYHVDFTKNATKTSAFELKRAYLGYKYNISKDVSVNVTFDVGNNTGGSSYTAFAKIAQLDWKVAPSLILSMGLIGMNQFSEQEKFWGYRYVFNSFQDANGFGPTADLGINAEIALSEKLLANVTVTNGEGFRNLQDNDGNQKFGVNLVYKPVKGLTTSVMFDSQSSDNSDAITTIGVFAGYNFENWRIGAEYNKLNNGKTYSTAANDHNLDGFSIYSTYAFNGKFEIFGRYDQLQSNTLSGDVNAWNYGKDGERIITGIQYNALKGIKFSLNYQGFSFDNSTLDNKSLVFLNAEFKL
ncbi:outer membrane protein [Lutibacter sp.]|uniref:outer membrane protein n=1 Tax=Lutibacter sp. TaxID=1925666 RepID=UPI002735B08C|nr:hypothetical protein [Lutibacter sp.]MDP3313167.1 hypothetical protein [Lutibacter sp.]